MGDTGQEHREAWLDGVRGIAILMVLAAHYLRFESGTFGDLANAVLRAGWVGVDLFFVLSGFLITGILLRARGGSGYFRNFYARRALRIFPAYYGYLAVVFLVLVPWFPGTVDSMILNWVPSHLFYVQNLAIVDEAQWPPWRAVHHLWSLAIEEQFYWIWPLVIAFVPIVRLRQVCLWVCVLAWSCKALLAALDAWPMALFVHTLCRMDALALGAWLAADRADPARRDRSGAAAAVLFACGAMFIPIWAVAPGVGGQPAWGVGVVTSLAGLAGAAFLYLGLQARATVLRAALSVRWLMGVGKYSYGLYVLHLLVQLLVQPALARALAPLPHNAVALFSALGTAAAALLAAMVLYHTIEAPALSLKRHVPMPPAR